MQEITLSNNLAQIELEISHHKQIAGQSIWEIGRRLNHVKEHDLAHGEFIQWLKKINIERTEAHRMMKVAEQLPDVATLQHLGTTALHLIATLPDDQKREQLERIENGDNPTVRELQELKRENNRLKAENARLEQQKENLAEQALKQEVIEKEVIVEKVPDDYNYFKSNYEASKGVQEFYKKQNEELREEMKELEKIIKAQRNNSASQSELQKLEDKKAILTSEIESLDKIANFQEAVETFISDNASLSYTKDFENLYTNREITLSLLDTFNRLEKWIENTKTLLPDCNIIEGE
ncbi:DUF3102 domain-containing protein [Streptococcus agalactiae]|uniref:DUF3102 domain-containing protein n=1 Tax=Streptococcus agalactiae TaxID=1311 RepID=UPI0002BB043B|nr:DUF3102 domain-containing protein [Streptococcus agalactiae]EPV00985.1 hypothetical protein SAG0324_02255 [Streptococcus agalactiae GB00300]EPW23626.1 hypothetical protein SAG0062_03380 [Streptococcus agalactiae CCUG 37739]EPW97667.1 hypothetical protein SAG0140_11070 [Streptococcus agalactiae MRI Z1-022]EPX30114.1 hypothetical protein SAG0088_01560 [Streptococcus agalactiae LMG 15092]EQA30175.1 hypothetical protein SAG0142_01155 [Streptococcus agalactiae MRI Z1-024]